MNIRQEVKRDLTKLVNAVRKDERTTSVYEGYKLMLKIRNLKKKILSSLDK